MRVSIIETRGIVWQGISAKAILPTPEGPMCVLDFHQPFLSRLAKGNIRLPEMETAIKEGVALMNNNELKVFVEF